MNNRNNFSVVAYRQTFLYYILSAIVSIAILLASSTVHAASDATDSVSTDSVSTADSSQTAIKSPTGRLIKKSVEEFANLAKGNYTGLIVDCRGMGLKPVMSPVILNSNGTKIFGHKNLDVDKIVSTGMVDYVQDENAVSRAGENPLVVKPIKLENFNSNPVLSIVDSNRVLIENHATKFLKELKVVFLFD